MIVKTQTSFILHLKADLSNQSEFLTAVRNEFKSKGPVGFFLLQPSSTRHVEAGHDEGIMQVYCKKEDGRQLGEAAKEEDSSKRASADESSYASVTKTPRRFDSVARAILGRNITFVDADGVPEPLETSKIRFGLYNQLLMATGAHRGRTSICIEGDCYTLLTMVLKSLAITKRSGFSVMAAFGDLRDKVMLSPNFTVAHLVVKLTELQRAAELVSLSGEDNLTVNDSLLKGALLHVISKSPDFKKLADDFSRVDDHHTYQQIIEELLAYEQDCVVRKAPTAATATPITWESQQREVQMAAFYKHWKATTGKSGPSSKPSATKEECRNFLNGRCTRSAERCKYAHPAGKEGSTATRSDASSGKSDKSKTCFKCQRTDGHRAADCPNDYVAPPPRTKAPSGAKHAPPTSAATARHEEDLSIQEFMAMMASAQLAPATSTEECNMLTNRLPTTKEGPGGTGAINPKLFAQLVELIRGCSDVGFGECTDTYDWVMELARHEVGHSSMPVIEVYSLKLGEETNSDLSSKMPVHKLEHPADVRIGHFMFGTGGHFVNLEPAGINDAIVPIHHAGSALYGVIWIVSPSGRTKMRIVDRGTIPWGRSELMDSGSVVLRRWCKVKGISPLAMSNEGIIQVRTCCSITSVLAGLLQLAEKQGRMAKPDSTCVAQAIANQGAAQPTSQAALTLSAEGNIATEPGRSSDMMPTADCADILSAQQDDAPNFPVSSDFLSKSGPQPVMMTKWKFQSIDTSYRCEARHVCTGISSKHDDQDMYTPAMAHPLEPKIVNQPVLLSNAFIDLTIDEDEDSAESVTFPDPRGHPLGMSRAQIRRAERRARASAKKDGERQHAPMSQCLSAAVGGIGREQSAVAAPCRANNSAEDTGEDQRALLDSGASSHFLFKRDAALSATGRVSTANPCNVASANAGETEPMRSLGRCDVVPDDGPSSIEYEQALLMPPKALRQRLASLGRLTSRGYTFFFYEDNCLIFRHHRFHSRVKRDGYLYFLPFNEGSDAEHNDDDANRDDIKEAVANEDGLHAAVRSFVANLDAPSSDQICGGGAAHDQGVVQAQVARVYTGTTNFRLRLHRKFNHQSMCEGGPTDMQCKATFGKEYTEAPPMPECEHCMINKTHHLPHPRLSSSERQDVAGDGPVGKLFLDSFSWPFSGERGERVASLLYNQGRGIKPIVSQTREQTPGLVIEAMKVIAKSAGQRYLALDVTDQHVTVAVDEEVDLKEIKYLISDGAAEFMGTELTKFCATNGIVKTATCRYTPQQNQAENIGKIVMQGIATLMHQFGGPKMFWTRALKHFCSVHFVMPSKGPTASFTTPYEATYQRTVPWARLIKHLHPFGCKGYLYIPRALRAHTHGVPKAIVVVYLGLSSSKHGHVVLTLESRKVIDGVWDVYFVEDCFPLAVAARSLTDPIVTDSATEDAVRMWADSLGNHPSSADPASDNDGTSRQSSIDLTTDDIMDHKTAVGPSDDASGEEWGSTTQPEQPDTGSDPLTVIMSEVNQSPLGGEPPAPSSWGIGEPSNTQIPDPEVEQPGLSSNVTQDEPRRSKRGWQPSGGQLRNIAHAAGLQRPTRRSLAPELALAVYEAALTGPVSGPPDNRAEMLRRGDAQTWLKAETEHVAKLVGLEVFKEVRRPPGVNVMRGRWVYASKVRAHSEGEVENSARYTAMGFTQRLGWDYDEVYAPTMSLVSYRTNEARAVNEPGVITEAWDAIGAYYQTVQIGAQYIKRPPLAPADLRRAYPELHPQEAQRKYDEVVWLLLKCMPGTKDAGFQYDQQKVQTLVVEAGMTVNPADDASFDLVKGDVWLSLTTHCDDISAFSNHQRLLDYVFNIFNKRFPSKRKQGINVVVGIHVERSINLTMFHQTPLIDDITKLAGQERCDQVWTPTHAQWPGFAPEDLVHPEDSRRAEFDLFPYRQILGKIAYVSRCTRVDIAWVTAELQRYQTTYGQAMIEVLTHLVRYLKTTRERKLVYRGGHSGSHPLIIAVDASYANSKIARHSHGGYVFSLLGCMVAWASRRQSIIALSSFESEFMEAFNAAKMSTWVVRLLTGFRIQVTRPIPMLEDNEASIYMSQRPNLNSGKARHMDVRFNWLQVQVAEGNIVLIYLPTEWQVADILTKAVDRATFRRLSGILQGEEKFTTPAVEEALNQLRDRVSHTVAVTKQRAAHTRPTEFAGMLREIAEDERSTEEDSVEVETVAGPAPTMINAQPSSSSSSSSSSSRSSPITWQARVYTSQGTAHATISDVQWVATSPHGIVNTLAHLRRAAHSRLHRATDAWLQELDKEWAENGSHARSEPIEAEYNAATAEFKHYTAAARAGSPVQEARDQVQGPAQGVTVPIHTAQPNAARNEQRSIAPAQARYGEGLPPGRWIQHDGFEELVSESGIAIFARDGAEGRVAHHEQRGAPALHEPAVGPLTSAPTPALKRRDRIRIDGRHWGRVMSVYPDGDLEVVYESMDTRRYTVSPNRVTKAVDQRSRRRSLRVIRDGQTALANAQRHGMVSQYPGHLQATRRLAVFN